MQFNSYLFILVFLPVVVTVYFLLNRVNIKAGKIFLILMSAIFYINAGIKCVIVLAMSMVVNYGISLMICNKSEKKTKERKWLISGIAVDIIILFCKHSNMSA